MDPSDHAFGTTEPYSLGVEEELFLVDPSTGRQTNTSREVLARVADVPGTVEPELHACEVELITGIHATVGQAVAEIREMRHAVTQTGAGILGSGTHPSSEEGEAEITDKERYERVHDLLGDAIVTPVAGLHVHVGMPDPETAIRVFNGLRNHLPLLQALSANSPFRHGRDSGLASARDMTMRAWPRSGIPRAMSDFDAFCEMSEAVSHAAGVPDYTYFWWKVRPHPRLGTVEVRALDTQTSTEELAALVALVHCLAKHLAEETSPPAAVASEILDENIFRAGRSGVEAELVDASGERVPVPAILDALLARLGPHADDLHCTRELDALPELVVGGGGAGRQRSIYDIAGIEAVTRKLTELTASCVDAPDATEI
jgi:glutamate---cysteine ligase / carboxylate-amine ligase